MAVWIRTKPVACGCRTFERVETKHGQQLEEAEGFGAKATSHRVIGVEKRPLFFQHIPVTTKPHSSIGKILYTIYGHGKGWVFTPGYFSGMKEDPRAVGVALGRLNKQGVIRRLARGIYDYPKDHPKLGRLTPNPDSIARALAGNGKIRLQPTGA